MKLKEDGKNVPFAYCIATYEPSFGTSYNFFQNQSSFHCLSSLDMYAIFHYEPLHNLHLGITKMLLRLVHVRLRGTTVRSSRPVHGVNVFIREVETMYWCTEFHVDHSVTSKPHNWNVFSPKKVLRECLRHLHLVKLRSYLL